MKETKPTMEASERRSDAARAGNSVSAPSLAPSEGATSGISTDDCGCGKAKADATAVRTPISTSIGANDAAPSLHLAQGDSAGITAWLSSKRVTGLWSINQDRNSWAYIDGIGWRKLANNSNSAIVALTMLSAHAFDRARTINYREESDGMVREIYVF